MTSTPLRRRTALYCGVAAISIALIGWIYHIAVFRSVFPGFVMMRVNTTVCMAFCGFALLILLRREAGPTGKGEEKP